MTMPKSITLVATLAIALTTSAAPAPELTWPGFRGHEMRGVAPSAKVPDQWTTKQNVKWVVPVPGNGWSSPIVWGDTVYVTSAIGKIFYENSIASGCIPQISAIMGPCIGVGSYSPALTDFIIQVQNTSQMFITGPAVIKEVLGEAVTMEELGGAKIHSEVSGVTDLVAKDDEECLAMIRRLLGFLPSNFESPPPRKAPTDDSARPLDALVKIVPEDMKRAYNIIQVIKAIVDDGDFFELKAKFARNLVTGFGRLDGYPVGFFANQPMFIARRFDLES